MKSLLAIPIWLGALALAVLVFRRLRRGETVPWLRRIDPRLLRAMACLLVILGVGGRNESRAQGEGKGATLDRSEPAPIVESWPATIGVAEVSAWLRRDSRFDELDLDGRDRWIQSDLEMIDRIDLAAVLAGSIDTCEHQGRFDRRIGEAFRRAALRLDETLGPAALDLREPLHRIGVYQDLTDALIIARAELKPALPTPHAWMSKAGPSAFERQKMATSAKLVLERARKVYRRVRLPGSSRTLSVWFQVAPESGGLKVHRRGSAVILPPGADYRFDRLDLIEAAGEKPAVLVHAKFGRVFIEAGRVIGERRLPGAKDAAAKAVVRAALQRALAGDALARDELAESLLLVQDELLAAMREDPVLVGNHFSVPLFLLLESTAPAGLQVPPLPTPTLPK